MAEVFEDAIDGADQNKGHTDVHCQEWTLNFSSRDACSTAASVEDTSDDAER